MNWKSKFKSPSFWTAIVGAIVILVRASGIEMGEQITDGIINAMCGLLVVFGIFSDSGSAKKSLDDATGIVNGVEDLSDEVVKMKNKTEK